MAKGSAKQVCSKHSTLIRSRFTSSTEENLADVRSLFQGFPDSDEILRELEKSYVPRFAEGVRTKYGFYAMLENELAGLSLLGISNWKDRRGYTGAGHAAAHARARSCRHAVSRTCFTWRSRSSGIESRETGCFVSNLRLEEINRKDRRLSIGRRVARARTESAG
jgi:hypothetical protein